jgi:hypothetical protein
MSAIASARQAISELRTIATTLTDIRDFNKLPAIQAELNQRILDLQEAVLELQSQFAANSDALDAFKARLTRLEATERERKRYALYEIRPGVFVYRRRKEVKPPEPDHYLCQPCFDKGVKVVLEAQKSDVGAKMQTCPVCARRIAVQ